MVGFPLTRQQRDTPQGLELRYWLVGDSGAHEVQISNSEAIFFVRQQDQQAITRSLEDLSGWQLKPLELLSLKGDPIAGLYCSSLAIYREAIERLQANSIAVMEEDIRPTDRYLMERFIRTGATVVQTHQGIELRPVDYTPQLKLLSLDIETTLTTNKILSIAMQMGDQQLVLLNSQQAEAPWIECFGTEKAMLQRFVELVQLWDPDIFIGWAVIGFDLRVLLRRAKDLGVRLQLGRDQETLFVEQGQAGRWFARIGGRIVLDGIETLKAASWHFERYGLEYVARELLGRGKKIDHPEDRGEEIQRLYREEPLALCQYNLEDCRLVTDIFAKAGLLEYLIERARLTGLALDKVGGSQQAFDNLYLPKLHRAGYVAPEYASGQDDLEVPGGFVMESVPGLFSNVLVFDFKSLYPSIIRTFSIDPLGLALAEQVPEERRVAGFFGAQFNPDVAILPGIISELWQARDRAKAEGNAAFSQAIKIQMNACYGVLGSKVCRFFDQRLSGAITLRGHELLQRSAEFIERTRGHRVIYGDTDSVFVWLGDDWQHEDTPAYGFQLATEVNRWLTDMLQTEYGVQSALELQFESEFSRFLMPRMRHSDKGSKKRYAGLKRVAQGTELVFKGLESVRTDWTPAAREFQQALYQRVFHDQPWEEYVREYVASVYAGERDEALLYRKSLRRSLEAYDASNPPHVKAARKLQRYLKERSLPSNLGRGDRVEYWITVQGPEPRVCARSAIDYQHYIDKQLRPVADSLLPFLGAHFDQLIAPQIDLF